MTTTFPEYYQQSVTTLLLSQCSMPNTEDNPEQVLTGTLELLSHFLNLNKGRIFLWDAQTSRLDIAYSYGLSSAQINVGKYEICEGITGEVLNSGKPIAVKDVSEDYRYKGKISSIESVAKRSKTYIALPIKYQSIDLGVLAVECNNSDDSDIEANIKILTLIVERFADIIYRYNLNDFANEEVA